MLFKASAPGSLMLLGEYAVLQEGFAVVAAINQRLYVQLIPRNDLKIIIRSALGVYETNISQLNVIEPFQFILSTLMTYQSQLISGFELIIESDFSDQLGFGSSAAVTVATMQAFNSWLNQSCTSSEMIQKGRDIIRHVQGVGSGADIAASVLGGIVAYRAMPFHTEKFSYKIPINVIYSGSKTKTPDAIKKVNDFFSPYPELHQQILKGIDACAQLGIEEIRKKNVAGFGKIMSIQQGLMQSLGVCNQALSTILNNLSDDIIGAKISGSGLGDCIVALTTDPGKNNIEITEEGVHLEKE